MMMMVVAMIIIKCLYALFFVQRNTLHRTEYQTVNDGVAHAKNPRKCAYHVTFDLHLDLEHTLDARCPGVHLCESLVAIRPFAWQKKRFAQKFTDRQTDRQTDRRWTPRHCISSFLE